MYHTYVLENQSGKRYVGQTSDLADRIGRHNSSKYGYTKSGRPWLLIYSESFATRSEAIEQEKFLKSGRGRDFIDNLR